MLSHAIGTHLHTDILGWIPPSTPARIEQLPSSEIRSAVFDRRWKLYLDDPCGGSPFCFGDLHIAGPTRVDVSPMGAGRREAGQSMLVLFVWARAVREAGPMLIVVENVPRFPVNLLDSLFGDMYRIIGHFLRPLRLVRLVGGEGFMRF